ncbi:MAG: glycosyltransferase family 2 protein [Opitutales bacterium]
MVDPSGTDNFSVSVIIPTFNRVEYLPDALDSVYSQTHPVTEVIVVDDGSTDHTVEKLSPSYPSVQFLRQENQGVSSARNLGIAKASHPWIALLDSDDRWTPQKLERQITHLSQNPSLRAVHTGEKWIRDGKEINIPASLDKSKEGLWERSLEKCIICPSSVLLHQSVFEKTGTFDPSLAICEDYDFWLRLLLTHQVGLIEEPLVHKYGGHPDQLSMSTWGLDRFRVQSLEKISTFKNITPRHRAQIYETIIRKTDLLIQGFKKHGKYEEAQRYQVQKDTAIHELSLLSENIVS